MCLCDLFIEAKKQTRSLRVKEFQRGQNKQMQRKKQLLQLTGKFVLYGELEKYGKA